MDKRVSSSFSLAIILITAAFIGTFLWMSNYRDTKLEQKTDLKDGRLPTEKICSQEAKICSDGSTVSRTGPNCEFAPCPDFSNDDRNIFINDVYKYEFKYPREATINEARQQDFGLPANSSLSFEEAYKKYTGKICISINYKNGGLNISAPANKDYQYVLCGRTGIGSDVRVVSSKEKIQIDGIEYNLNFQTLSGKKDKSVYGSVILNDDTRIDFFGSPDMKDDLKKIVESYKKIK